MLTKILAALVVCAAAAAPAMAGEITGNGKRIEQRYDYAESICSFSGLNDELYDEEWDDYDPTAPRVQSYGQDVRAGLKGIVPSPSDFCKGN